MDSELDLKIARVAQECWCKFMLKEGWRLGDRYDPEAKTHHRLRPYDELSPFDQDEILQYMRELEFEDQFASSVDDLFWSRNDLRRELTVQDMRVGLVVCYPDSDAPLRGKVVSWEVGNPQIGRLEGICVEWEDGEVVDHTARECELAIVDEP